MPGAHNGKVSEVHPLTFRKLDGYGEHPLFHSDRGFQYTSNEFKRMIDKVKIHRVCHVLVSVLIMSDGIFLGNT